MRLRATMAVFTGVSAICAVLLSGCGGSPSASPTAPASVAISSTAEPTPTPADVPSPTPTVSAVPMTVVAPKTLLGRSRATESSVKNLAVTAAKGIDAAPGGVKVSAAYGTLKQKNIIVFVAVTGANADGGEFLDAVATNAFPKMKFRTVDAGSLGGAARCADASSAGTPSTFCMWADHETVGMIYFLFSAASHADTLLAQARGQIEVAK